MREPVPTKASRKSELTHYQVASAESNRVRLAPRPRDPFYLHMKDLRRALGMVLGDPRGSWLDFGCGGSPYRPLLQNVTRYIRGDITGEDLDVLVHPGEELDIQEATLDGVVSTQVLEHVSDADWYLRECARLLAPGGRLVLTTHGIWADHFWPNDYQRWTAQGLKQQVESCGFRVVRLLGLTCGIRALVTLWELGGRVRVGSGLGAVVRVGWLGGWAAYKVARSIVNPIIDAASEPDAIRECDGDTEGAMYVDVLVDAVRL